jgi:hypothetical protein
VTLYTPLGVRLTDYIPHYPEPPQEASLSLVCLESLYGGAAGGGKSDALLMGALQYVDIPGYAAILFRRVFPELGKAGGLIPRSKEWLSSTDAVWNENDRKWTFPSGATIEFGHIQREDDVRDYGSTEYQYIGYDELTEFTEFQWTFLLSRLRRPSDPRNPLSQVPLRARGASNPGGRGHRWVKRRFIDREPNPEDPEDTPEKCARRIFIPAKLEDNPHVDREAYRESLAMLDPQTRAQLEDGDWNVREPGAWVFDHLAIDACEELGRRFDELGIKGMPPPIGSVMACGIDWGDNATVMEPIWGLERGGIYVPPGEIHTSRQDLEKITDEILGAMGNYPWWFGEERYDASFAQSNRTFAAVAERELGPHNPRRRSGRPNTYKVAFAKHKDPIIRYLRLLMNRTREFIDGKGDGTRVLAISPLNTLLLDQLRGYKEDHFGKPLKGDDDAVDALIAGASPVQRAHKGTMDERTAQAKAKASRAAKKRVLPSQVAN